ncbi:Uncharacterised protein [Mycobacteroides abscessus subsp. abscessus]|nr:Uncharacterised protein [Mycobacteroides abscessus subsp. abscessus]
MLPQADAAGQHRQGPLGDDGGPTLGQLPLGQVREAVVQLGGHGQAEHGVPEELEALVVRGAGVLVGVGAVGQRKQQRLGVDVDAETLQKLSVGRGVHGGNLDQASATLRPLYSKYSGVPAESVTTLAWCGRL